MKLNGYAAISPGFTGAPLIVNGASELLVEIFGEKGKHARTAIGVAELPHGIPVEVEVIAAIKSL